jgi:hypothetical protein
MWHRQVGGHARNDRHGRLSSLVPSFSGSVHEPGSDEEDDGRHPTGLDASAGRLHEEDDWKEGACAMATNQERGNLRRRTSS